MEQSSTRARAARPRRGRPLAKPPDGYVSLATAAERAGCQYITVYRYANDGKVPAIRQNGTWFVAESAIATIRDQLASSSEPLDPRVGVFLRVAPERYAQWEKAARDEGRDVAVSTWVGSVADRAAGRAQKRRRK